MILRKGELYIYRGPSIQRRGYWHDQFDPCSLNPGDKFICLETKLSEEVWKKTYVKIVSPDGKIFVDGFYPEDEFERVEA